MEGNQFNVDLRSVLLGIAAGVCAGGGLGYVLGRRRHRREFDHRLDAEVADVKAHYQDRLDKAEDDLGKAMEDLALAEETAADPDPYVRRDPGSAVAGEGGDTDDGPSSVGTIRDPRPELTPADVSQDPLEGLVTPEDAEAMDEEDRLNEEASQNVFALAEQSRGKAKPPYPISMTEFSDTPPGAQSITLTYYAGDGVLCDDKDEPIRDTRRLVGPLNPLKFGGISEDPHVLYVRNEELEVDFEVILNKRAYADAVLNYGRPNRNNGP